MGGAEAERGSHSSGVCTKHSLRMRGPEWMKNSCVLQTISLLNFCSVSKVDGYLCVTGLLVPPLFKVFLQLHLSLLQQVLNVLYLRLQFPQLSIQCLEAVHSDASKFIFLPTPPVSSGNHPSGILNFYVKAELVP